MRTNMQRRGKITTKEKKIGKHLQYLAQRFCDGASMEVERAANNPYYEFQSLWRVIWVRDGAPASGNRSEETLLTGDKIAAHLGREMHAALRVGSNALWVNMVPVLSQRVYQTDL